MSSLVISGGRVIDPAQKLDRVCDLLLDNGAVAHLGDGLSGDE